MQKNQAARIACGFSSNVDTMAACEEAISDVAPAMAGETDLAIVCFSREHVSRAGVIGSAVLDALAPGTLVGNSASGVIANDREYDRSPGLVILAMSLPGVECRTFTEDDLDWPNSRKNPERLRQVIGADDDDLRGIMLLADPQTPLLRLVPALSNAVEQSLDEAPIPMFGGVASAGARPGENRLLCNNEVRIGGIVGIGFHGPVRIDTLVSQGCRPIGRPHVVTSTSHNIIETLGGQPVLGVIQEMAQSLPERDLGLLRQGLFVGRVVNEYQDRFGRGDFLIRNVVAVDQRHGYIGVNDMVRVGQTVQFHVRDSATATEDLELLLAAQQLDEPAVGAMLFTCTGRGLNLFDEAHHDASTISRILGDIPMAGFFAGGEIGPIAHEAFLHGHTACLALFRSY